MTTVRVYYSTDASAPVLSGQAGALVGVLDACLVNGYGSKSAAGWTIPYTGTNLRSYKTGRSGWNAYLYINDTSTYDATCRGYSNMTSATDSGTNPFPPPTAVANNLSGGLVTQLAYIPKSSTADATARPWVLIADPYTFYLFVETGYLASAGVGYKAFGFGEFYSYTPSDTNNFFISSCQTASSSNGYSILGMVNPTATAINLATINAYNFNQGLYGNVFSEWLALPHSGQGAAIAVTKVVNSLLTPSTGLNYFAMGTVAPFINQPNPADGTILYSPVQLLENDAAGLCQNTLRGHLRGLWAPGIGLGHLVQASGYGTLSSKTFMGILASGPSATYKVTNPAMEISSTWDTN